VARPDVDGDLIGRIFDKWVNVNFGQLYLNCKSIQHIWDMYFIPRKSIRINFEKKWVGLYFFDFFTNSVGHPGGYLAAG
jgi:hypothetical protein